MPGREVRFASPPQAATCRSSRDPWPDTQQCRLHRPRQTPVDDSGSCSVTTHVAGSARTSTAVLPRAAQHRASHHTPTATARRQTPAVQPASRLASQLASKTVKSVGRINFSPDTKQSMASLPVHRVQHVHQDHKVQQVQHKNERRRGRRSVDTPCVEPFPNPASPVLCPTQFTNTSCQHKLHAYRSTPPVYVWRNRLL
jgi:hypothetical protein